jgi:hypothetical protein
VGPFALGLGRSSLMGRGAEAGRATLMMISKLIGKRQESSGTHAIVRWEGLVFRPRSHTKSLGEGLVFLIQKNSILRSKHHMYLGGGPQLDVGAVIKERAASYVAGPGFELKLFLYGAPKECAGCLGSWERKPGRL